MPTASSVAPNAWKNARNYPACVERMLMIKAAGSNARSSSTSETGDANDCLIGTPVAGKYFRRKEKFFIMSKTYSVLVVGVGKRGLHHATFFKANPRFELIGISSRDPARLQNALS